MRIYKMKPTPEQLKKLNNEFAEVCGVMERNPKLAERCGMRDMLSKRGSKR